MMPPTICHCGAPAEYSHIVARRSTADGKSVLLWSHGHLTWRFGEYVRGSAHPRTATQVAAALAAGWLLLGDVELWEAEEVPTLAAAARQVAARSGLPGDLRKRMAELLEPAGPVPHWTTYQTDRDGKPTVRVWRLPRLTHPGIVVWHEKGLYSVLLHHRGSSDTFNDTGFVFSTVRELRRHLRDDYR